MPSFLEIDSVVKTFDIKPVLTDIYFSCKTGDIVGIFGRNGTGKSTFLKILFGSLSAESKFIRIDNKIYDKPYKTYGEISFLPQDSFLPQQLSVKKVVELYLNSDQISSFFDDSILFHLQKNKITHLSGGELRYLEIKLLLNQNSKFVLLDEPFNGMSPILIESVKKLVVQNSENKGVILTDHDYRNVLEVANRFCVFFDGGIKEISDKSELVKWGYISESKKI